MAQVWGCLAPCIVLMAMKASCQVTDGCKEITFSRSEKKVILRSFCFRFDEEIDVNYAKNGVRGLRKQGHGNPWFKEFRGEKEPPGSCFSEENLSSTCCSLAACQPFACRGMVGLAPGPPLRSP